MSVYTVFSEDGSYSHNLLGLLMEDEVPGGFDSVESQRVVPGEFGEGYCQIAGEVMARGEMPLLFSSSELIADDSDSVIITGVPVGATVVWPDGYVSVEGEGVVEFSTAELGVHRFRFHHPHYFEREVDFEAID